MNQGWSADIVYQTQSVHHYTSRKIPHHSVVYSCRLCLLYGGLRNYDSAKKTPLGERRTVGRDGHSGSRCRTLKFTLHAHLMWFLFVFCYCAIQG